MSIDEITICLHCGCSKEVVDNQMASLKSLESKYKIHWNNRIDRHPGMYDTYSRLINHSVETSPTEYVILINDRCSPKAYEVEKMIKLLESGFSCVLMYNVGFMGFSKELIRTSGWWDEGFKKGWEDRDWVWRIRLANLSLYESQEAEYDYSWKSPLNHSGNYCEEGYLYSKYNFSQPGFLLKNFPEKYDTEEVLGPKNEEIRNSWKDWDKSILKLYFDKPNSGPAGTSYIDGRQIIETYK
jgi:hypothetical protein